MFKSKIFFKAMFVVATVIAVYTFAISIFVIPKINDSIKSAEEKSSKEILSKIVTISKNVYKDLESSKKRSLQAHKQELKDLTDSVWSIVKLKYEESKPENLHSLLQKRGEMFKKNLLHYYNNNKDKMTEAELKAAIKNYTNIYRHNSLSTGYFWINDMNATMVMHPINHELNGKNLWNYKDPNGVTLFQNFIKICRKDGSAIVRYQWVNPENGKVEDKISYVFLFKPLNWIFGTGEYYSVLDRTFKQEVIDIVNKIRYADNNYFFIVDNNSKVLSHPYLRGKDMSNVRDIMGNLIVPNLIKVALNDGEGFFTYWWKKNSKDNKPYEKLTYSKNFPNWNMILGTGVYIDDIAKELHKRKEELMLQLREIVKNTKIGKTGYLYIFDGDANMLIHPNSNIDGKNFSKLKNPTKESYIFDDLVEAYKNGSKYLYYKWDKPTDKGNYIYDKLSWIEYIPELNWYIVSSAYVDEIEESAEKLKDFILLVATIIFIISTFYSYIILKNLLKPISNLSDMALKVTDGNYSVRSDISSKDEVGILANSINKMVDSMQDNLQNLDKKVEDKVIELRKSEHYIQAIMNSQTNIVLTTDDYIMKTANKAFYEFFNLKSMDEFIDKYGECICDTFVEREGYIQKDMSGERWIDYIANRQEEIHKVIILRDALEHIFSITVHEFDFDGDIFKTAVFTDITEDEHKTKELEIVKNRALEATKSKSEFLANMSHEIRTPMNGIIGMSHLALQTHLDDRQKNYIQKIDSSAKSLLGIINDILDFSKIEAGKLTLEKINFDLFGVIESVINMLEFKAHDKGLDLIVDYDLRLAKEFFGDSLRIGQVLTNLLTNAIKFTESGQISVIVTYISDEKVLFEVKDTGIGMTKAQQSRVFKSFSQADGSTTRKYGGTGLGLVISKKLVELMNGEIWLESVYKKGSSFKFDIELQQIKRKDAYIHMPKNTKVLVIDNSFGWQKVFRYMLEEFGLDIDIAGTVEEAAKLIKKSEYSVILLDAKLPDFDTADVTKTIKSICGEKRCPKIIMVSTFKDANILNSSKNIGIDYSITKPINPYLLNSTFSDILFGTTFLKDDNHTKYNSLKSDITALSGSKILLVEDNKTNQEVILGLLENSGIIIDVANNGKECVELFKKTDYELILMDLQMPVMDGYEATKVIRQTDKDIPIAALTANAMKDDMKKSKDVGMNAHLNKPIEVEKLYEMLLKYISKKGVVRDIKEDSFEDIDIPEFTHLDVEYALKMLMGNRRIYLRILRGLLEYKNIDLSLKDEQEFKIVIHTIKGISASAGASDLHKITSKLDETGDKSLITEFNIRLQEVIEEIEDKLSEESQKAKKELDDNTKQSLLDELKTALKTKRAKNIRPVMNKFNEYKMEAEDKKLFDNIEKLVKRFKFKQALELL
jgi:signal transduction histidine kinase/CheY-like chemotaxis protein